MYTAPIERLHTAPTEELSAPIEGVCTAPSKGNAHRTLKREVLCADPLEPAMQEVEMSPYMSSCYKAFE